MAYLQINVNTYSPIVFLSSEVMKYILKYIETHRVVVPGNHHLLVNVPPVKLCWDEVL